MISVETPLPPTDSQEQAMISEEGFSWAWITKDYFDSSDTECSVLAGDRVELLNDHDRHWWLVRMASGKLGYVPADTVEMGWEREARLNLIKNEELCRWQPEKGEVPWQASVAQSGFVRKRVSFSTQEQQVVYYETEQPEEADSEPVLSSPTVVALPTVPMDTRAEQLLRDWLAELEETETCERDERDDDDDRNKPNYERDERNGLKTKPQAETNEAEVKVERQTSSSLWARWRGKLRSTSASSDAEVPCLPSDGQMVKIYAGNLGETAGGYRTLLLQEDAVLDTVARQCLLKFGLEGDGHDYRLACVHSETGELLPVDGRATIGHIIECAKLLRAREILATDKEKEKEGVEVSKRTRKLAKKCLERLRGADLAQHLPRDRQSDYATPFQFILNRDHAPFHLRVALGSNHARLPVTDEKETVSQAIDQALQLLQVTLLPGMTYVARLVVDAPRAKQPGLPVDPAVPLVQLLTVWPLVDVSYLCLRLYPE